MCSFCNFKSNEKPSVIRKRSSIQQNLPVLKDKELIQKKDMILPTLYQCPKCGRGSKATENEQNNSS